MKINEKALELSRIREFGFKKGVGVGVPLLDKHLNYLKGNTLYVHAFENQGKSTLVRWIHMQLAIKHEWRIKIYDTESGNEEHVFTHLIQLYCQKKINELTDDEYKEGFRFVNKHFFVVSSPMMIEEFLVDACDYDAVLVDHIGTIKNRVNYDFIDQFLPEFSQMMIEAKTHGTIIVHSKKNIGKLRKQITPNDEEIHFYPPAMINEIWMGESWAKYGNNVLHYWRPSRDMVNKDGQKYKDGICFLFTQKIKPDQCGTKNPDVGFELQYWHEKFRFHDETLNRYEVITKPSVMKPNENFLDKLLE